MFGKTEMDNPAQCDTWQRKYLFAIKLYLLIQYSFLRFYSPKFIGQKMLFCLIMGVSCFKIFRIFANFETVRGS